MAAVVTEGGMVVVVVTVVPEGGMVVVVVTEAAPQPLMQAEDQSQDTLEQAVLTQVNIVFSIYRLNGKLQ